MGFSDTKIQAQEVRDTACLTTGGALMQEHSNSSMFHDYSLFHWARERAVSLEPVEYISNTLNVARIPP